MLFTDYFNSYMDFLIVYICMKACESILRLDSRPQARKLVPLAAEASHPVPGVQMLRFDPSSSLLGLPNLP